MTELKPCPFCGSEDIAIEVGHIEYPNKYSVYVRCKNCDKGDLISYLNEEKAVEAWNTRYEPTCKRIEGGKKYGSVKWVCSECGYGLGDKRHNYCPSCGRVIEE